MFIMCFSMALITKNCNVSFLYSDIIIVVKTILLITFHAVLKQET